MDYDRPTGSREFFWEYRAALKGDALSFESIGQSPKVLYYMLMFKWCLEMSKLGSLHAQSQSQKAK